jgi:uncharacterized protein YoxC
MPANKQSNPNFFTLPASFDQAKSSQILIDAQAKPTASAANLPIVSTNTNNAVSPNIDERNKQGSTNISIYATGLGATANTGLKKSNQNLAHACDSSSYVGLAISQAGAFGGKVVQAIRDAIKAILKYFGVNPSGSGITNQLKKLAEDIQDATKFIKEITDEITKFISYVNAIKQLLSYILSLPAQLLEYFKDCVALLKKQLVAGFQSALDNTPDPNQAAIDDLKNAIKDVQSSISQFTTSVATLTATAAQAALSLVTPGQTAIANTQQQAAATQAVYAAAGFAPTTNNFSKA